MWTFVWIALVTMVVALLVQHLGLSEAMASVVVKVAKCHQCLTFWSTLFVLTILGCHLMLSIALSILMSYLSNFLALLLMWMQGLYTRLWEKVRNK